MFGRQLKLKILFRNTAHLELRSAGTQLIWVWWVIEYHVNGFRQGFVISDRHE